MLLNDYGRLRARDFFAVIVDKGFVMIKNTLLDQLNSGTVYQPKQRDATVYVRLKLTYLTYILASQKHINFLITT